MKYTYISTYLVLILSTLAKSFKNGTKYIVRNLQHGSIPFQSVTDFNDDDDGGISRSYDMKTYSLSKFIMGLVFRTFTKLMRFRIQLRD